MAENLPLNFHAWGYFHRQPLWDFGLARRTAAFLRGIALRRIYPKEGPEREHCGILAEISPSAR